MKRTKATCCRNLLLRGHFRGTIVFPLPASSGPARIFLLLKNMTAYRIPQKCNRASEWPLSPLSGSILSFIFDNSVVLLLLGLHLALHPLFYRPLNKISTFSIIEFLYLCTWRDFH